jgi:hypothetical protein
VHRIYGKRKTTINGKENFKELFETLLKNNQAHRVGRFYAARRDWLS